jgi:hypothetical protein
MFFFNIPLGVVTIAALAVFFHPPTRSVENDTESGYGDSVFREWPYFCPSNFHDLTRVAMGRYEVFLGIRSHHWLVRSGAVVLIFFGVYQWWKGDMAMIPPSILMNRTVLLASLTAMCGLGAMSLFGLWMAEWFQVCCGSVGEERNPNTQQVIKDDSPVQSGVNILPAMLGQIVSTLFAGAMSSFLGYYNPFPIAGSAFLSIGTGLFTIMGPGTKTVKWAGFEVFYGLGAGMFVTG